MFIKCDNCHTLLLKTNRSVSPMLGQLRIPMEWAENMDIDSCIISSAYSSVCVHVDIHKSSNKKGQTCNGPVSMTGFFFFFLKIILQTQTKRKQVQRWGWGQQTSTKSKLVGRCLKPSQPQRIISGLKETFIKRVS